jgi:hypothetical protein
VKVRPFSSIPAGGTHCRGHTAGGTDKRGARPPPGDVSSGTNVTRMVSSRFVGSVLLGEPRHGGEKRRLSPCHNLRVNYSSTLAVVRIRVAFGVVARHPPQSALP